MNFHPLGLTHDEIHLGSGMVMRAVYKLSVSHLRQCEYIFEFPTDEMWNEFTKIWWSPGVGRVCVCDAPLVQIGWMVDGHICFWSRWHLEHLKFSPDTPDGPDTNELTIHSSTAPIRGFSITHCLQSHTIDSTVSLIWFPCIEYRCRPFINHSIHFQSDIRPFICRIEVTFE